MRLLYLDRQRCLSVIWTGKDCYIFAEKYEKCCGKLWKVLPFSICSIDLMCSFFICPKVVLWYTNFCKFFPPIGLKFFGVGFSDFLHYEITNERKVCEFVTSTKVVPLLYLIMFQSAQNWYTCSLIRSIDSFFFKILIFIDFIGFFLYFWDIINFLGGIQTMFKLNFYGFHRVNGPF